jgi:cytochrome b subunit of formate dehydrogenase
MVPNLNDAKELLQTFKWFFGLGPQPQYGRWTYWEKFDFMAVFWGVAVIGTTGLTLWFPEIFTIVIPGYWINIATIIHSDEALLASGFIFTIHFFNTHLRPEKFPMDPVIFTGTMPLDELKHERPREYAQLVAEGKLDEVKVPPTPRWFFVVSHIFGFTALAIGLSLVVSIIYSMIFLYVK